MTVVAMGVSVLVVAMLLHGAANREKHRVAPAVVFTSTFDVPDVGFYDLAASRIRPQILHEIECSIAGAEACSQSDNGQHLWHEDRVVFDAAGRIAEVRIEPFWWCDYCKAGTNIRPIPPVNRPWAIITAEQFLKETS